MNDREMLLLLYGAIKTQQDTPPGNFNRIVRMVEDHLWPGADANASKPDTGQIIGLTCPTGAALRPRAD